MSSEMWAKSESESERESMRLVGNIYILTTTGSRLIAEFDHLFASNSFFLPNSFQGSLLLRFHRMPMRLNFSLRRHFRIMRISFYYDYYFQMDETHK